MGFESFLNEGKVFTEVTDEERAFQTVGAARLKALSVRIVLEKGTASRFSWYIQLRTTRKHSVTVTAKRYTSLLFTSAAVQ